MRYRARVIHHDGRVGTKSRVHLANSTWVDFDDAPGEWVRVRYLRPLGPIEEELRSSAYVDDEVGRDCQDWSPDTWALWHDCRTSLKCAVLGVDELSEAIEACARIWEQHGVAL